MFKHSFSLHFLFAALLLGLATACGSDDDIAGPVTGELPQAGFTYAASASGTLTVEFTNTSTNAVSYSWDFGDGNTATEANPNHTYDTAGVYTVKLTATNPSGSDEASESVTVASPYRGSGYVLTSAAVSSNTTYYARYFAELPTGEVDMTQGQSFPFLFIRDWAGPFLYGTPENNTESAMVKYAIDSRNDRLVEVDRISTLENPSRVEIISDELGFFANFGELKVTAFNPTTMEVTQEIDLAANTPLPAAPARGSRGVSGLFYNEVTGKLIATLYFNDDATGQFYDAASIFAEIIDVASLQREGSTEQPNASYPVFRGEENTIVDAAGNLYLLAAGSYGLDFQIGPTAARGSRPQILKLSADGTFDVDYAWNPIDAAGFTNNAFQMLNSMIGAGEGKAIGIGTAAADSPRLLELLGLLAANQITEAQYDELRAIVFTDESNRVMSIDLEAKTVSLVEDIPATAGFTYPQLYDYNGKIYSQVIGNSGAFSGYYAIDPATYAASPQFRVTAGGNAIQLLKLGE